MYMKANWEKIKDMQSQNEDMIKIPLHLLNTMHLGHTASQQA